jgi:uncharacterized protein YjgD (DUF1641 family)
MTNQSINSSIVEKTTKAGSACASYTGIKQEVILSDLTIKGNFVMNDLSQEAQISVNFKCINKVTMLTIIQSDMITKMMGEFDSISSKEMQNEIANRLAASAESSGFQLLTSDADSNVNSTTKVSNTSVNESRANVKQVVENVVKNVFTEESLNECLSRVNTTQIFGVKRVVVDGDMTFNDIAQKAVVSVFATCISEQTFGTDITTQFLQSAGLSVDIVDEVLNVNNATTDAEASAKKTGLLGDKFGDKKNKLLIPFAGSAAIISLISMAGVAAMVLL